MKEFMLIMKGDDSKQASPEEMQSRMQGYMTWMKKMMAEGRLKAGQPLEPRGVWLKDADHVATDGPFLEPREIIGGYVILLADDLEQAAELAKACPLLSHCEIFVRPLVEIPA
jgi:hypothetical protein